MTNQIENVLAVVAKRPAAGKTKTRLTPLLAPDEAASLYACFLKDTLDLIRRVPRVHPVIAYDPAEEEAYFQQLAPDFELSLQRGPSLGARLAYVLSYYLQSGYRRVVIMDSDSPSLPAACLMDAFHALERGNDVVLGPCEDGGYYLVGATQPIPRLLLEVQMSTDHVTADTLQLAAEEGLKVALLSTWYDIDGVDSLARLASELEGDGSHGAHFTRQKLLDLKSHLKGIIPG